MRQGVIDAISRVAAGTGVLSTSYRLACSRVKGAFSIENFHNSTVSDAAVAELMALRGYRIFDSFQPPAPPHRPTPRPCPATEEFVGGFTYSQVMRTPAMASKPLAWAGNWVLFVSAAHPARFAAVCGFFDCADRQTLVKHMNLCTVQKMCERVAVDPTPPQPQFMYMCSGTFVVTSDGKKGKKGKKERHAAVIVNVRSGSWAIAKSLLRVAAAVPLTLSDEGLDDTVARFAKRHVRPVLLRALRLE